MWQDYGSSSSGHAVRMNDKKHRYNSVMTQQYWPLIELRAVTFLTDRKTKASVRRTHFPVVQASSITHHHPSRKAEHTNMSCTNTQRTTLKKVGLRCSQPSN